MARWVDGAKAGEGHWTNTALASCEDCGVDLGPGEAMLRRCRGGCDLEEHLVPDPRGTPRGGVHVRCRDEGACRRRQTPRGPGKRELAAAIAASAPASTPAPAIVDGPVAAPEAAVALDHPAALLCAIAELVERDGSLLPRERRSISAAVLECVVRRDELLVELLAAADVVRALTPEPAWGAVRAAAAACVARDMAEYDQVEFVLSLAGAARAAPVEERRVAA